MHAAAVVSRSVMVALAVAVMVLGPGGRLGIGIAHAAENEEEGKRRFTAGQQLYEEGKYLEAAREFEAGYAAAPRPAFLLNIARAYHKAGELKKAKAHFDLLLQLAPEFEQRADLAEQIRQIDEELAAQRADAARKEQQAKQQAQKETVPVQKPADTKAVGTQPDAKPDAKVVPTTTTQPPAAIEFERRNVLTLEQAQASQQKDSSLLSSPWFWVVTVGVLVAGGVAIALLAQPADVGCTASVCLTEPR